jgi:transcriptional regulator GlxA family with amidase domain
MARSVGWRPWRPPGARVQPEGVDKRRIVFVIFDGFRSLDLTGPYEVFQHASPLSAEYDCQVVSRTPGPVRSSSGLPVTGRRVTTHWSRARQLADEHPELIVDCDPIFIRDGPVWTSAGVSAGMDLALALVEDDLGQPAAHAVAQELVLFLRRPGTQSQFSVAPSDYRDRFGSLREYA